MNGYLVAVYFLIGIGTDSSVRKLQEDFPETAWKNTKAFLWSMSIFNNSSFNTFPGISQNLPENVSFFFAKMIDLCLLTQKNQTL